MPTESERTLRPRRSALYMPGANARALDKGRTLPADVLIMDVEDGVLPDAKIEARERIVAEIATGGYAPREVVVRINAMGTEWFEDDIAAFAACGADALLVPKVDGPETVALVAERRAGAGAPPETGIWCMLETPLGILNARDTAAAHPRPEFFVINIGDLMMRWTNDRWLSNMHRVVNPPPRVASTAGRISIGFFHQPDYDAVVECIPTCAGPGRPALYPAVRSGDYRDKKYEETLVAGEVS